MIVTDQEYANQSLPAGVSLPNRERLRAKGVTFNNHQATTTVCTPSRSVMWTGQHVPHTGMIDNTNLVWQEDMRADPETLPTIGHMLRELGYYTAFKGKWHESDFQEGDTTEAMESYGFSDYQAWGEVQGTAQDGMKTDPKITAEAVGWLKTRGVECADNDQPWFLAVNLVNPHDIMWFDSNLDEKVQKSGMFPIVGPPDKSLYQQQWSTTLPGSFGDDLSEQPPGVQSYKQFTEHAYGRIPSERQDMWHNYINYYINCMIDVDQHFGMLLNTLEEGGLAENTVIIFTSDHGEMGGAHCLTQKGSVAFKESINVPLTIIDPRESGGDLTTAVGSHLDLVPTCLAYAGISEGERSQRYPFLKGHDLSGVVSDPGSDGPRGSSQNPGKGALLTYDMIWTTDAAWLHKNAPVLIDMVATRAGLEFKRGKSEFPAILERIGAPNLENRELFRGVFDGRYKLVRYFGLGNFHLPESVDDLLANNDVALYDLQLDPEEMNNLANRDNPDFDEKRLAEMNLKLNALITAEIGNDQALFDISEFKGGQSA
jgi:arylsulfatase A-like enzyme